jgi:tetratricopeptide (TPR) repeat protein
VPVHDEHFEQRKAEWERDQSIEVAAELVGTAIVLGRTGEVVPAARLLADAGSDATATLREMALHALGESPARPSPKRASHPGRLERSSLYIQISRLRQYLHRNPRDAYGWVDIARVYTILGQNAKARQALFAAVAIAPEDRFVLRASARYFVHVEEPNAAQSLLLRARSTAQDPWLMAAEIAVAQSVDRTSPNVSQAIKYLKLNTWPPRSRSELSGSVGTQLLYDGATQQARQFFRNSLVDGTENAIAQVEWASARTSGLIVPAELLRGPDSHEARALRDRTTGNWDDAIDRCWDWLEYEPTSTRPLVMGSYVASIAHEDGEVILEFTERGLDTEPNNAILLNNKAVGLLYLGRIEEAVNILSKIVIENVSMNGQPVLYATTGLCLFRSGDPVAGRTFYERAISHPYASQDRRVHALALWHLALEETRIHSQEAQAVIERAERASKEIKLPEIGTLRDRIAARTKESNRRQYGKLAGASPPVRIKPR